MWSVLCLGVHGVTTARRHGHVEANARLFVPLWGAKCHARAACGHPWCPCSCPKELSTTVPARNSINGASIRASCNST